MNLENSNKENTGPQKVLEYDILKNVHNLLEYEDASTFEDPKMVAYKDNVKQLLQNLVKKLDDNYKRNTFLEHEILRLKREHVGSILGFVMSQYLIVLLYRILNQKKFKKN